MIWVFAEVAVLVVIFFSSGVYIINKVVHVTSEVERCARIKDPIHSVHMVLSSEVTYYVWAAKYILYIRYNTCGNNRSMWCVIPCWEEISSIQRRG